LIDCDEKGALKRAILDLRTKDAPGSIHLPGAFISS
jgi:hypothetical protein